MALSQELDYVTEAKCVSCSRYPVTVEMRSLCTSQPLWAVARLCAPVAILQMEKDRLPVNEDTVRKWEWQWQEMILAF